ADLYITPYLSKEQITSGTLAYTVGAGKAVISTPYWHAEELLADERGILVPFNDPAAIASKVAYLLENDAEMHAMRKRAYLLGREMVWSKVASRYVDTFEQARSEPVSRPASAVPVDLHPGQPSELPSLNLYHLSQMTDTTGMLQHAIFSLPNYNEGYTTDDNARALILAVMLEQLGEEWLTGSQELSSRYLSFLWHAYNPTNGRFRNFMGFDRRWLEDVGSEDSHGRSLWAVGLVSGRSSHAELRAVASTLFNWGLGGALSLTSPRSWAFSILGITEYLKQFKGDRVANSVGMELAQRLMDLYVSINTTDWRWFENSVTYCNAALSQAVMEVGEWGGRQDMIDAGLESLQWLLDLQITPAGYFSPIGSHGFYTRGGEKADFDQQPVEAQTMISACLYAQHITGDETWMARARTIFDWFTGRNVLGRALYDPETGGCRDGIHPDRTNQNQGAESTLSFYLSLLELRLAQQQPGQINPGFDAEALHLLPTQIRTGSK
ncbi:MAG TPA: hypothetical protein VF823_02800, partial [Anaerolineales bacterium]